MALQGTIDSFPLSDVLHLLSSSAKTGRLRLEGDRGVASIWLQEGRVVGGGPRAAASDPAASLVLAMLRFTDGSFVFDTETGAERPDVDVAPVALEECVESARELARRWAAVEAVVPSLDHRVGLRAELPEASVTLTATEWAAVVLAAQAPSASELTGALGLDDYDGCSLVAELVGRGVLDVGEPAARPEGFPDRFPIDDLIAQAPASSVDPWTTIDGTGAAPAPVADAPETSWDDLIDEALDSTVPVEASPVTSPDAAVAEPDAGEELAAVTGDGRQDIGHGGGDAPDRVEGRGLVAGGSDPEGPDPDAAAADRGAPDPADPEPQDRDAADLDSTDEVLRQMARLSPKAAEAIAAALNSVPGAEHGGPDDPSDAMSFLEHR